MPNTPLNLRILRNAVPAALAMALALGPARAAVTVSLTPTNQTVTPGTDFDLFLDVTAAGTAFNGYEVVVEFDPAVLTPVPLAPTTLQQGCLMTGGCSGACGTTFHQFSWAGDSVKVNNVLLCNQVTLTGPGRLYRFRFHASNTPQATLVNIRRMRCFDAGLLVTPVNTSNAVVGVGVNVGVGDTPLAAVSVRAEPNPSRGAVAFVASGAHTAVEGVDVLDLQGRVLRHLDASAPSSASLAWDGTDERGARVPPGVYHARVRLKDRVQNLRIVLLP